MKVFIAMPYSQLCDENYNLKPKYKNFCQKLTGKIKNLGWDYFLAHERENWGKDYCSAEESTQIDFDTIKDSDLIVMIPGNPISGGVHVELGWASANNKKINLFLKKDADYSPMVTGIGCLTEANYYYYDNDYSDELIEKIIASINKYDCTIKRRVKCIK